MIAQNCEGPHKGPTVRMQLGRGHVDLCEESPFKTREGEAESESFEDVSVREKERLVRVRLIISAYRDSCLARKDLQVYVKFLPEDMKFVLGFPLFVRVNVLVGVQLGGLSQKGFWSPSIEGLVVNRRWRVQCCFRSSHLKREKGREKTKV